MVHSNCACTRLVNIATDSGLYNAVHDTNAKTIPYSLSLVFISLFIVHLFLLMVHLFLLIVHLFLLMVHLFLLMVHLFLLMVHLFLLMVHLFLLMVHLFCFYSWCICFYLWSLVSFFLPTGAGGVRFSLRDATYHNNSLVALEDIGKNDSTALLCVTDQTACCQTPYAGDLGNAIGNWFFPNGSGVPSTTINYTSNLQWDFYRTRGQMVVRLHRRTGGVTGIYHCVIPDKMNVTQNLYVRVYTNNTGEYMTTKMLAI